MQSKDNTCPDYDNAYKNEQQANLKHYKPGQQEDKPTKAEQCYRCGCAPCRCGEDDSKPEKPLERITQIFEQLWWAKQQGTTDQWKEHQLKGFTNAIQALLATEYDRGVKDGMELYSKLNQLGASDESGE